MTKAEIHDSVYPMWQAAQLAEDMAYDIANPELRGTFSTGIPFIDEVLNPQPVGTLMTNLGRPSNGKTMLSNYFIMQTLNRMKQENRPQNEICVLVTTETSIEVTAMYMLSRITGIPVGQVLRGLRQVQLDKISASVYDLMGMPLFLIGVSAQRNKLGRREMPVLYPQTITDALDYIMNEFKNEETDQRYEVKFMVTDYLHNLSIPAGMDERRFYSDTVSWAKNTAYHIGGIHMLNAQAKRQVDDRDIKIPMKQDGMETSAIEHKSQVMWSCHMPHAYNLEIMSAIKRGGVDIPEIPVQDNLMYISLIKQQEGIHNRIWPLLVDFNTLEFKLHPLQVQHNRLLERRENTGMRY